MFSLTALLVPLTAALPAADGRPFNADALARDIAPFVEGRTVAVVHVDLARLDPGPLAERLAPFTGNDAGRKAAARQVLTQVAELTKAGGRDVYLIVSLADLPERGPFFVLPVSAERAKTLAGVVLKTPGLPGGYGVTEFEGALVVAEAGTATRSAR